MAKRTQNIVEELPPKLMRVEDVPPELLDHFVPPNENRAELMETLASPIVINRPVIETNVVGPPNEWEEQVIPPRRQLVIPPALESRGISPPPAAQPQQTALSIGGANLLVLQEQAINGYLRSYTLKTRRPRNSISDYLEALRPDFRHLLRNFLRVHKGAKFWISLRVEYTSLTGDKTVEGHLSPRARRVLITDNTENILSALFQDIEERNGNFIREQSGLVLSSIHSAQLHLAKYNPLGGSYKRLPVHIEKGGAVINVKNEYDNECFRWAVLAALHPVDVHAEHIRHYIDYIEDLDFDGISFPVSPRDVPRFEHLNQISINIIGFYDEKGERKYPIYISKKDYPDKVNLLYFSGHYAWIKNFDRFLRGATKHHDRKYFCMKCLCHFIRQDLLDAHTPHCEPGDFPKQVLRMPPEGRKLRFQNLPFMQEAPFVIYSDCESILQKVEQQVCFY